MSSCSFFISSVTPDRSFKLLEACRFSFFCFGLSGSSGAEPWMSSTGRILQLKHSNLKPLRSASAPFRTFFDVKPTKMPQVTNKLKKRTYDMRKIFQFFSVFTCWRINIAVEYLNSADVRAHVAAVRPNPEMQHSARTRSVLLNRHRRHCDVELLDDDTDYIVGILSRLAPFLGPMFCPPSNAILLQIHKRQGLFMLERHVLVLFSKWRNS